MAGSLRAGVIGAGVFGGRHAAKYAQMSGVRLTAVNDPHPDRAAALARRFAASPFDDLAAFLEAVDIVSVASPASAHAPAALAALAAGKHVYVEKPIATCLEDADAIVAAAREGGLVAACGFLERAVFKAIGLLDIGEPPRRLEAERLGPPARRNLDVSVVLDLMIHDLDLALCLTRADPLTVEASGACVANSLLDEAEAEIDFDGGFTVRARASRVASGPARTMKLVYPSGQITIDFLTHAFENTTPFLLDCAYDSTPAGHDRLGASLAAFVAAVRNQTSVPLADAEDGARALDLALAVEQAVGR
ncbi:MAG TPA: Gfo/Idh/MocA family oxidoreductase [Caulobacteraceae bacterium]